MGRVVYLDNCFSFLLKKDPKNVTMVGVKYYISEINDDLESGGNHVIF